MFAFRRIRFHKFVALAAVVPITTTLKNRYDNTWIHRKDSIEIRKFNRNCSLPNGTNLGTVHVYTDVMCERTDKKRISWDIDGDHKHVCIQFKLNDNQCIINDINKYHWIQFVRRNKTNKENKRLQELMNTSPSLYQYRYEWYLNVPRTRDIKKQTKFYERYGLHNRSENELSIFVNPKGWFDAEQHNELLIELESYLVVKINDDINDGSNEKYLVLFRVHCQKQYDESHPSGHFIKFYCQSVNQMIDPMQSDKQWMIGYSEDDQLVQVHNNIATKIDVLLMR